ncbi:MAG: tRNA (N6-threonylcarbamoyladenosine(37)-N6)-methyltransferase TrmO [Halodesulfurarchaeum sp.]
MNSVEFEPIGHVESEFEQPSDIPRPANEPVEASGTVVLEDQYEPGLLGLEEFSHVVLVSHLHLVDHVSLQVTPTGIDAPIGIFATSGTARPNPIGLSIVRLEGISNTRLSVSNLDLVDGTPILDVKPFAPKIRDLDTIDYGWMAAEEA